jgi:hypothetical protein
MHEFPKMLFKPGGATEIWGRQVFVTIVPDQAAQDEAVSDGFCVDWADLPSDESLKRPAKPKATSDA